MSDTTNSAERIAKALELLEEAFVDGFNAVETYNDTRYNNGPDTWKEMDARYGYAKRLAELFKDGKPAELPGLSDERAAFEQWAREEFYSGIACPSDTWSEKRGGYSDYAHHMAYYAYRAALAASAAKAVPSLAVVAGWQPIETAPEGAPVVVAWWESDETPHHDFDQKEDGCWQRWHDHAEHVEVIGGHGVSYTAPYTHWLPLPGVPHPTKEQP